jgi:hypothetical protein
MAKTFRIVWQCLLILFLTAVLAQIYDFTAAWGNFGKSDVTVKLVTVCLSAALVFRNEPWWNSTEHNHHLHHWYKARLKK